MAKAAALLADYLGGETIRELSIRHGISPTTLYRHIQYESMGMDSAAISRRSRETLMQDTAARVARMAGQAFNLRPGLIWTDSRKRHVVRARQAAFLVAYEAGVSGNAIARAFGLDHSTVLYGRQQAQNIADRDPCFAAAIDEMRAAAGFTPEFSPETRVIATGSQTRESPGYKWMPSFDQRAAKADAEHAIDPHEVRVIVRKVAAQAEQLEAGLGDA